MSKSSVVTRLIAVFLIAAVVMGCARGTVVFAASAIGTSTTDWFELPAGRYALRYTATDQEPWWGCRFRLVLVRQPHDRIAGGVNVHEPTPVAIPPRGKVHVDDDLSLPRLSAGAYYLRGEGACVAWDAEVVRLGD